MNQDANATQTSTAKLEAQQPASIKADLNLHDPSTVADAAAQDPELVAKAEQFVAVLLEIDPADVNSRGTGTSAVETMGLDLQRRAAQKSQMLKQPVHKLAQRSEDGGEVANALVDLKMEVENLDPGEVDFEPGWFTRLLGRIPGVGTPLKRYFTRFESAQTVIDAIIRSLEVGRDQLTRDNVTLTDDQKIMRELTIKLERTTQLGILIDHKLQERLDNELQAGSDKHRFVAEELLFPLRQRIIDLQQQLAVNQQGVLASELIIRNNKELIRGVNRALNVTVSALHVGATVAIALANQKVVIDKIDAVNKTTSDLIAGTAKRLRTQGAQIHKQAASAQIEVETLKAAFVDIHAALNDIATFRQNALPQMAQTVLELDRLTKETEDTIKDIEAGNAARPKIDISIE
ncbi:MAG: toxic anion resistance protein [Gammaproteobacteria bacterium]|nr:toxic anion resistance protein [Gammaproteobacteria bacterium]